MNRVIGILLVIIFSACTEQFLGKSPGNTPVDTFEQFWHGVDATWPEFETKHVNWDSLYSVYRPKVTSVTSDNHLQIVLTDLLANLKDSHTTIYPRNYHPIIYYPAFPPNFYGIGWLKVNYFPGYKSNGTVTYGLLTKDIGYIHISTFSNSPDQYTLIDNILSDFKGIKGMIIDVRGNTGGNSTNSIAIASRFADQKRTYEFVRFRLSEQRNLLSDFIPDEISPSGYLFRGKVAVLTNRYSYSATENFVLMMKSFPTVVQIGDNTGGGSGTRPILKELPNGWSCRVSSMLLCDLNKQPITKGIIPNIFVQTTKSDSLRGKDSIIERAILELN